MRRSTDRILTTHTGSLPRPESLTDLFVRRAGGEPVDAGDLAAAGREAVRAIVPKQAEVGIDIGNDGEQQRESFFLYLRERLTGLGGSWQRPSRADIDRYPEFKKRWDAQMAAAKHVSPLAGLPMALGEVRYVGADAIDAECRTLAGVLAAHPQVFAEAFMNAPSPGMLAAAIRNQHYDTLKSYLQALGEALRVEYEAIVRAGFVLQIDAPDLALERHVSYKDEPVASSSASSSAWWPPSTRPCATSRATVSACTCAGATPSRRTTRTCRSPTSCRRCSRRTSAVSCCRLPGRATLTSSSASRRGRCRTIRSSWPA